MLQKQFFALRLLIEKISVRERYLLLATLVALILALTQGVLMVIGLDKHDLVLQRIEQKKTETDRVKQVLVDYQAALNNPQVLALQNSNKKLLDDLSRLEQNIDQINDKLMSPDRMIALLKELLYKKSNLTVVKFDVLPITTIASNVDGGTLFYQHSLHIELEGQFESLTLYLDQIENLSEQLFWDDLIIETETFPILNIQLNVHTLSQNEEWLNV